MLGALVLSALTATADARCAPMVSAFHANRPVVTASGLKYLVTKPGARKLHTGQVAIVSYLLCLPDGTYVDSSGKNASFAFALGEKQVVKGFEEAVRHVGLGGEIQAWLPSALGYGMKGSPPVIKPNAELVFRIGLAGMADTSLSLQLMHAFDRGGVPAMQAAYAAAAAKQFAGMYAREDDLNSLGYRFIKKKHPDAAIAALAMNVQRFPGSWNAYDSLGDAYNLAGQKAPAIENYQRALELNPKDQNAIEQLKKLKGP